MLREPGSLMGKHVWYRCIVCHGEGVTCEHCDPPGGLRCDVCGGNGGWMELQLPAGLRPSSPDAKRDGWRVW